ncbi:hypothetical protein [Streptomyces sp. NRRL F-5123]|uniref:hypothetical protein n=1 Tax=Streptomyces sp. NRRL F-5123 TaxID=1463856 RepID=UPI0004E0E0BD|nr:hypothetical protein [Streptomyces sp. NRRL F-5123]
MGPLRDALEQQGFAVVEVNWKNALKETGADYPGISLEQLYVEAWRLFFADGLADGRKIDQEIPRAYSEFTSSSMLESLAGTPQGARPSGLVGSALVEFAVDYLLQAEFIRPAMAEGKVTLADGFGFKNVTKVLKLAGEMPQSERSIPRESLDALVGAVRAAYASPFLQPTLGILLDADPALTYDWRTRQAGGLGFGEDYSVTGRSDRDSYIELQTYMAEQYRSAAAEWGWQVIPVDGRPQSETVAEARRIVTGHPAFRR